MSTKGPDEFAPENPIGAHGFEFVEFAADNPDELAAQLARLGFHETAVHRSRPWIRLFRQGSMNCILNRRSDDDGDPAPPGTTRISAFAIQVADAGRAIRHAADHGAWTLPSHAGPMELVIPGVEGIGASSIFFVDRFGDRTIYEVDFVPRTPAPTDFPPSGLDGFERVIHDVAPGRAEECADFYRQVLGLFEDPRERTATHRLLRSPSGAIGIAVREGAGELELTQELAIRCGDLRASVAELQRRGIGFERTPGAQDLIEDVPGPSGHASHHLRARLKPLSGGLRITLTQTVAAG